MTPDHPDSARIVIIGGGIMGCSTAYHLAALGATDVILLERAKLTCGTTWHSAAQVRQLRSTVNLTRLTAHSAALYAGLAAQTGQETGWRQCGSLSIATHPDRLTHILRQASLAHALGVEVQEVDRAAVQALWPLARTDDVIGAVYSPTDGRVNPSDVCAALVKAARGMGVRFYEDTPVTGFSAENATVTGVATTRGHIACEKVVVCAGLWSRALGLLAGVGIPLHACEHYALITRPIEGMSAEMPMLADHDGYLYIREEVGGILAGCFEPNARPIALEDLPADFCFDLLKEDWEHFEPMMVNAMHRVPALEHAEARMLLNGPESFTPDNHFVLGEAPALRGFFVGCGMNSIGVGSGGGAGRALAEWVVDGEPGMDLATVDVRRFGAFRNCLRTVRERAAETLSVHYAMSYPGREPETVRNVRVSALHARLAAHGAHFGERAGWERARYFTEGEPLARTLTFARPPWFERVAREHRGAREAVALFDQSPLGKLRIEGPDAERFLQRVCANDVGIAPGRVVYSPVLNARGGYESDVVLLRLDEQAFLYITGAAQTVRDSHWLHRHLGDARAAVTEVTSAWAVIGVMGPRARDLMARVSPQEFSNNAFPYLSHRDIEIGPVTGRAVRISYVGELGWELHVPSEMAQAAYDTLADAGRDLGLVHAGSDAQTSLRIESARLAWGHDIGPDDTPLEAGMGFAVKIGKRFAFIGRDALLSAAAAGPTRRRVLVALDDPALELNGAEPIVIDGEIRGYTTSAAYGHSVGRAIGLGYISLNTTPVRELLATARFEVEIANRRHAAKATLGALHDPTGLRPRDVAKLPTR